MPRWIPAYIGLGSNLDSPARQLQETFAALDEIPKTKLISQSGLYRSAPFGGIEQPDFVNAAAALLTQLPAIELLQQLQAIERNKGRIRDEVRWGPRVLDLDLLLYSGEIIDEEALSIPHPGIGERNFVLLPLLEIAPQIRIPGLGPLASIEILSEPKIERIG